MRSKGDMDAIIAEGTAEELNLSAFWQEYSQACDVAKSQPPVQEEPAQEVPADGRHVKRKHNPARLSVPRDEFGNPIRHVDIHYL